jgi:hypothetical protein
MLNAPSAGDEHEKFKRLAALAVSGNLAPLELSELREHVLYCAPCREVLHQYHILTTQGMITLADSYLESGFSGWEETPSRDRLLARLAASEMVASEIVAGEVVGGEIVAGEIVAGEKSAPTELPKAVLPRPSAPRRLVAKPAAVMAIAAGLICAVALGGYRLGVRKAPRLVTSAAIPVDNGWQALSNEKRAADDTLAAQAKRLTQLQLESSEKEQELGKLRASLRTLEERSSALAAANGQSGAQLLALSQQRDALSGQLLSVNHEYENQKAELLSLRAEHDKTILRTSTLEAKINDLSATNRDQERRLKDAEQYLTSDRDIRELMGARKLYIADVFDVDGASRTQRPFGRVFYTQGKSLIFYAFDLDREPGVVNASTFQVWGQKEAPQGEKATPMNLGILYMDNESNRRWVMRFDEPRQLAEIDAVFVTVEPRGGSHKPTSKPFLYALLRNEANHP